MDTKKSQPVTQNDVAREAGVTRSMVSYVINGTAGRAVAPETRQRILDVIERLGYRPNKAAQALQQGDVAFAKNRVGVILRDSDVFRRPYYAEILAGIHTAAHEKKYNVVFIRFFEEFKNPVLFNELIHNEEIGGLILVATDQCIHTKEDVELIERMKERIQNIVCVDWKREGLSSVVFDRQEAAKKACKYMIEKGFSNIAYVGEKDERVFGVQQALMEEGRPSGIDDFYLVECFDMKGGYGSIRTILDSGKGIPEAIICGSDEVAYGALCSLNEAGYEVPGKVSVISIDNLENSSYTTPPLTCINVQKQAMGERAMEMIVNESAGQDEKAMVVTLPTSIVERLSVR